MWRLLYHTFLACSWLSGLQSFWLGVYLRQMVRARLHACVAPRVKQSLPRRRISVQIASALPQKIPLLVDFVFTLFHKYCL